jgi:gluconolactonase
MPCRRLNISDRNVCGDAAGHAPLSDGGRKAIKRTGGRPNGLALDGDGNLWIAEAGLRAVLCIDVEGRELMRIDHDGERPFRLPNDLCFRKDGHLYLTDSGMAAQDFLHGQDFADKFRKLPWDGRVYDIDPVKGAVLRIFGPRHSLCQWNRLWT